MFDEAMRKINLQTNEVLELKKSNDDGGREAEQKQAENERLTNVNIQIDGDNLRVRRHVNRLDSVLFEPNYHTEARAAEDELAGKESLSEEEDKFSQQMRRCVLLRDAEREYETKAVMFEKDMEELLKRNRKMENDFSEELDRLRAAVDNQKRELEDLTKSLDGARGEALEERTRRQKLEEALDDNARER